MGDQGNFRPDQRILLSSAICTCPLPRSDKSDSQTLTFVRHTYVLGTVLTVA